MKDLPKKKMQIGTTFQIYNSGKVYINSIFSLARTSIDIGQIRHKRIMSKNSFSLIDHLNITSNDLWVDDIHPTNSGKAVLARDLTEKVNKCLPEF